LDDTIKWDEIGRYYMKNSKLHTSKILVTKPGGKRPLVRPRCRWRDIKMDIKIQVWRENIGLVWLMTDTLAGSCKYMSLTSGLPKCGELSSWVGTNCSRRILLWGVTYSLFGQNIPSPSPIHPLCFPLSK
jgi:hypothetical protein